jgi:hypothetical protein
VPNVPKPPPNVPQNHRPMYLKTTAQCTSKPPPRTQTGPIPALLEAPKTNRERTVKHRKSTEDEPGPDRERTTEIQAIDRPGPSEKGPPIHLAGAPREGEVPQSGAVP